jgi:hypothetical protein
MQTLAKRAIRDVICEILTIAKKMLIIFKYFFKFILNKFKQKNPQSNEISINIDDEWTASLFEQQQQKRQTTEWQ